MNCGTLKVHRGAIALLICAALSPLPGSAEAFGNALYDPAGDELVVTLFYSGTNPDHQFSLRWDRCIAHPDGSTDVTAQVVDNQERDEARQEYPEDRAFQPQRTDLPPRQGHLARNARHLCRASSPRRALIGLASLSSTYRASRC